MPTKKVKERKKIKRNRSKNEGEDDKRERELLVFKDDGQEYAQVLSMLKGGRCEAKCIDGVTRTCHISYKMQNQVWIRVNDIILVGLGDYETVDKKADVLYKYRDSEVRILWACGEFPDDFRLNERIAGGFDGEDDFVVSCSGDVIICV